MRRTVTWVIVFSFFILLLCGCGMAESFERKTFVDKEIDDALARWQELAELNIEWIGENGWVHIDQSPAQERTTGMTYFRQSAWYAIEDGRITKGFSITSDPFSGQEAQIFVLDRDGYRADLVELRNNGRSSAQYAIPVKVNWDVLTISPTAQDLAVIESFKPGITNILIDEPENYNGAIKFTIEYSGEPTVGKMQFFYPNRDMSGRIETYAYDLKTGNQVAIEESYVYKNGSVEKLVAMTTTVEKFEKVPDDVWERLTRLEEEIAYYRKIFDK